MNQLRTLKLTDFDGENVENAITYVKNMSKLLKDNGREPQDFDDTVYNIFKASSCEDFVDHVKYIEKLQKTNVKMYSIEEYCKTFTDEYTKLLSMGKWTAKSTKKGQNSSFSAQYSTVGKKDLSNVMCLNCGELGHMIKQCPKPLNQAVIDARKKLIFKSRDGDAKYNGFRRGKKDRNFANKSDGEREKSIYRQPPKQDDPHVKTIAGKSLFWCGKCGKWTNHKTSEHKSKAELKKDEGRGAEVGKESASIASFITNGVTYAGATCQNVNF